jgi:hypothetical protein
MLLLASLTSTVYTVWECTEYIQRGGTGEYSFLNCRRQRWRSAGSMWYFIGLLQVVRGTVVSLL